MSKRKTIGLSIIIGLSLYAGYIMGSNSQRVSVATDTAIMGRDIVRGSRWYEDSAMTGILLYTHDFMAGCTGEGGYIIPSDVCLATYEMITGDIPVINTDLF